MGRYHNKPYIQHTHKVGQWGGTTTDLTYCTHKIGQCGGTTTNLTYSTHKVGQWEVPQHTLHTALIK